MRPSFFERLRYSVKDGVGAGIVKRFLLAVVILLALLTFCVLSGGCVSVDVDGWADEGRYYHDRYAPRRHTERYYRRPCGRRYTGRKDREFVIDLTDGLDVVDYFMGE